MAAPLLSVSGRRGGHRTGTVLHGIDVHGIVLHGIDAPALADDEPALAHASVGG